MRIKIDDGGYEKFMQYACSIIIAIILVLGICN